MTKAIALARSTHAASALEMLRIALICGCSAALILAGAVSPL